MSGIWSIYKDLDEISCVSRGLGENNYLVAVGDIYGRLRIWRWPATIKD